MKRKSINENGKWFLLQEKLVKRKYKLNEIVTYLFNHSSSCLALVLITYNSK